MGVDSEISELKREARESWASQTLFAITIKDGWHTLHWHGDGGVAPQHEYATPHEAVARLMQLMGIKEPVAPQHWPENVCVGLVERRG